MKIAYCLPCLCNSLGVERVVTTKANYLADVLGYEVAIFTTDQCGRVPFFALSPKVKLVDLGINYSQTDHTPIGKLYNSTVKRRRHARRLEKALADFCPDISIAVSRRELPILHKLKSGGVHIAERHMNKNCRLRDEYPSFGRAFRKWLSSREERWVSHYKCCATLTEQDKSFWRHNENMVVIPNPVTIKPKPSQHNNRKQVLAVGRICYEKGFDRLVKAWAIVTKKHPEWILSIVGPFDDIAEVKKLRRLIDSLQLSTVQIFPPSNDILYYYINSEILVLSSRYEGMPLVMLEAMSCGVPCVAFDCLCGPRNIISNGKDGLLVHNGDIANLAESVKLLIENPKLRQFMGENAVKKSQRYALTVIMRQWDALFKSLLNK